MFKLYHNHHDHQWCTGYLINCIQTTRLIMNWLWTDSIVFYSCSCNCSCSNQHTKHWYDQNQTTVGLDPVYSINTTIHVMDRVVQYTKHNDPCDDWCCLYNHACIYWFDHIGLITLVVCVELHWHTVTPYVVNGGVKSSLQLSSTAKHAPTVLNC